MFVIVWLLILDEELPSLTPWPCHEPTKKELADLDEQEKMEENQLITENEDHDYKMVYSRVHGLIFCRGDNRIVIEFPCLSRIRNRIIMHVFLKL